MSDKKKRTGLGAGAFFAVQAPEEQVEQENVVTSPKEETKKPTKAKKIRTTVTLYADTLAAMEQLKVEGRRETGNMLTLSDILDEAIKELVKKKGLRPEVNP